MKYLSASCDIAPGRYEVQPSCSLATEAPLDVGHELPPDVLEAVHTEGALLAGLAGDVPLAGVRAAEHGEHDVVLGGHSEVRGQVRAGLPNVGSLGGRIWVKNRILHRNICYGCDRWMVIIIITDIQGRLMI